jgi:hypothetical protein
MVVLTAQFPLDSLRLIRGENLADVIMEFAVRLLVDLFLHFEELARKHV